MLEWGKGGKPRTIPRVIRHFVDQAIFAGAIGHDRYGFAVAEHFMHFVPEDARRTSKATGRGKTALEFDLPLSSDSAETATAKMKSAARKVWTYLPDGGGVAVSHMPAIMFRSFIHSLPDPYRLECWNHVLRDDGFLGARIPDVASDDPGVLHEEYADTARTQGALLADDGKISADDSWADLRAYQKELLDLLGAVTGRVAFVQRVMKEKGERDG